MKKTTIREIAKMAGVSPRSVTRAFQEDSSIKQEKREKILELCREYGYKPNMIAARLFGKTLRFGICVESAENISVFKNEIIRGFKSAKEELLDYKVEIDIIVLECENNEELKKQINIFKEQEYDGIIINILKPHSETIQTLNESGIKIVCVNHIYYGVNSLFEVLNNCALSGKMAFEMLSFAMSGFKTKNIALFTGDNDLYSHKILKESFVSEAEKKGFNICAVYDTKDTVELAEQYAVEMLKRNDIDGIYISSANSVPIVEKIISAGKTEKIKIVASDVFPKLSEYIRKGIVLATVFQNPYRQAKLAVMNLYAHITENLEIPEVITVTPQIVINSNLEIYEMSEEIL